MEPVIMLRDKSHTGNLAQEQARRTLMDVGEANRDISSQLRGHHHHPFLCHQRTLLSTRPLLKTTLEFGRRRETEGRVVECAATVLELEAGYQDEAQADAEISIAQ